MILVVPLIAGFLLGAFFFGGLWWTVRRCLYSNLAGLWFSGSLLVRTLVSLIGIYFVSQKEWPKLLVCLLGFTLARITVTRVTRLKENPL